MKLNQRLANKNYYLMCKQERTGVCLDFKKASLLLESIKPMMSSIEEQVESTLPKKNQHQSSTKVIPGFSG